MNLSTNSKNTASEKVEKELKSLFKDLKNNKISSDILNSYTKSDLDEIRKYYGIPGASSLKKGDLVNKIVDFTKEHMEDIFSNHLNAEEFNLLKKITFDSDKTYIISYDEITLLKSLKILGLAFPCLINKENSVIIPSDYLDQIKELIRNRSVEEKIISSNKMIKIVKGCLYHYGVISINDIHPIILTYLKEDISMDNFIKLLNLYCKKYDDIRIKDKILCHKDIFNTNSLIENQQSKENLYYKQFSIDDILLYSDGNTFNWNHYETHLYAYLNSIMDVNSEEVSKIVNRCTIWIKNNFNIPTILNYLNTYVHFKDESQMIHVTPYIKDVMNNVSLWAFKGHCNNDLYGRKQTSTLITSNKIGRNDPCPCGSNKKYKKCCGK